MKNLLCLLTMVILCCATATRAQDRPLLPKVFTDGMVIQRDAAAPVWGFVAPGVRVTVKFADQSVEAVADETGRWTATLAPMAGSHESRVLRVETSDGRKQEASDVVVGDVYLLAGQSNMSWPVRAAQDDAVLAAADYPWLRVFLQASLDGAASEPRADNFWGKWSRCTPERAGAVSGVGFHFALELHKHVDVPIGLIHTAVGGTRIESWIDRPTLDQMPGTENFFAAVARSEARFEEDEKAHKAKLAEWEKTKEGRRPTIPNMLGDKRAKRPSALFNGLVAPLTPYAARGAIWYQGEGNASNNPTYYQTAMRTLIDAWRRDFKQPELPFMIVQLPGYHDGKQWPGTREAQRHAAANTPNAGLIVTHDQGDPSDLHPKSKVYIGQRAARLARALIYGHDIVATGPIVRQVTRDGNKLVVHFDHVGAGLKLTEGSIVRGFEVKGAAGEGAEAEFKPVGAKITGPDQVTIESPDATAVRYAWSAIPDTVNLVNSDDLPTATFLMEVTTK